MPVLKLTAVNSADAQLDDTINLNVLAMEAWLKLFNNLNNNLRLLNH